MAWIFSEKWFWKIVIAVIVILTIPFVIVWIILRLPPTLRLVATVCIIFGWGIAAGYKDWILSKRQKEKPA